MVPIPSALPAQPSFTFLTTPGPNGHTEIFFNLHYHLPYHPGDYIFSPFLSPTRVNRAVFSFPTVITLQNAGRICSVAWTDHPCTRWALMTQINR